MNHESFLNHKLRNLLHSVLLLGAMALLLAWLGQIFLGTSGLVLAIVAVVALFTLGRVSPHWVLRMHWAQPLAPAQAPDLYRLVAELARRGELRTVPALYLVPSQAINAFATGNASASTSSSASRGHSQKPGGVPADDVTHSNCRAATTWT